jgi:acyl-CoA thioester hydrolase
METAGKPFHEVTLQVQFHDLDPLQVVWHGNYFKYFETARFGLFEKCGVDLHLYHRDTNYIFPIVKTSTKHLFPLRHRDIFVCRASLREARFKIVMDFEIRLADTHRVCTTGRSEQVTVKVPEMEMQFMIPAEIRERLEA